MKNSTLHSTEIKQHFSMEQFVINKGIRVLSLWTDARGMTIEINSVLT